MRLRVFVGSSEKDRKYAAAIARILARETEVDVLEWWDHSVFPHGMTLIESLELAVAKANAAIIVAGPGDAVQKGAGELVWQPRDNVIFEYGMFVAAHGRKRVALATFHGKAELPSDIGGVLHIQLTDPGDCADFDKRCEELNGNEIRTWLAPLRASSASVVTLEHIRTMVGDIDTLLNTEVVPEIARATQVDMMSSYRPVSNVHKRLSTSEFHARAGNRLRVCFGNPWDLELARVYQRKTNRDPERMQQAVVESIGRYLGVDVKVDATDPDRIRVTAAAQCKADYRIYLTRQRITYNYCRVGDVAMIAPLDVKLAQDPTPVGWLLRRDRAPEAFAYYEKDFELMLSESQCVYGK
ncbi:MAG TPA: TIR domain-containing protein [Thermoanaerobaculia bacterium]